jgi:hypothetical protein
MGTILSLLPLPVTVMKELSKSISSYSRSIASLIRRPEMKMKLDISSVPQFIGILFGYGLKKLVPHPDREKSGRVFSM